MNLTIIDAKNIRPNPQTQDGPIFLSKRNLVSTNEHGFAGYSEQENKEGLCWFNRAL
jgi:hypothetical protein